MKSRTVYGLMISERSRNMQQKIRAHLVRYAQKHGIKEILISKLTDRDRADCQVLPKLLKGIKKLNEFMEMEDMTPENVIKPS